MWRLALPGLVVAALAVPASAQDADPFAKIFNDLKARWSAVDKADAQSADACAVGPVPHTSFQRTTVYPDATAAMAQSAPTSVDGMTWRSGDRLLQAEQEDIAFTGKPLPQ